MSDFYDYCNPDSLYLIPNNGILLFFFSKIFVETQDEVSIFTLLHTINIFFNYYHSFFTKFLLGDLFSGTIFWSSFGMESYGGTHDGDGIRWGGLGKNDH